MAFLFFIGLAKFAAAMAILVQQVAKLTEIFQNAKSIAQGLDESKWQGEDQKAFQQEMSGVVLPGVQQIIETASNFNSKIEQAKARMEQADKQAKGVVEQLVGFIQAI